MRYVSDRTAIHLALTLVMAWLGLILILPGDTFGGSRVWDSFHSIAGEPAWSLAFFTAAAIGAAGLVSSRRWVRIGSVLALASAHGMTATLFLVSYPPGAASGTYVIIAGLGYYLMARTQP